MPKLKFNYNIKKDAWSWVLIAKDKNMWGLNWRQQIAHIPDKLLEKIEKVGFSRAQKIVEDYIEKDPKKGYKNKVMYSEMQALKKSWKMVEKKYFEILSRITQQPIFRDKFSCYFTTGLMCPYNEKEGWFMVSMWHSVPFSITTICHETLHLQFLHHYKDYLERKMGILFEKDAIICKCLYCDSEFDLESADEDFKKFRKGDLNAIIAMSLELFLEANKRGLLGDEGINQKQCQSLLELSQALNKMLLSKGLLEEYHKDEKTGEIRILKEENFSY